MVVECTDFDAWRKILSSRQRDELSWTFTVKEIEVTLSQMALSKALGLDDLPPGFYQKFWPKVRDDVSVLVLKFFNF